MVVQISTGGCLYLLQSEGGLTWRELLAEIGIFAVEQGLAKPGFADALIERETNYPTGISSGLGVAIPHADTSCTNHTSMIVVTLKNPVMFRPMGGGVESVPVSAVFVLLMDDPQKHLGLLGVVASLIQSQAEMEELKGEEALNLLSDLFDPYFEVAK